jgi:hypothetical protein
VPGKIIKKSIKKAGILVFDYRPGKNLEFFYRDSHTVTGFKYVPFWDVNVIPQCIRGILSGILRHEAILVVIDIGNEFYLRFELQNFGHDKNVR